jgi:2-keto-4-pentenoate hydratase
MDDSTFEAACAALVMARREARPIEAWPEERLPHDLAEAYRLQAAVTRELGAIAGWKVAAVTAAQRETLGVEVAIGAPLLQPWMHDVRRSGAQLSVADFIVPKLECEFAFELVRDLAPRPGSPYSRKEVAEAILAMRIAVEIVDSRLPRGLGVRAELTDAFNNGAFVAGPRIHAWHSLDFAALAIVLTRAHDGTTEEIARGSGAAILDGDPFGTVVQLANAPPAIARGLLAGDIVTTGSCTGAPRLPGPGSYRADFGVLGSVEFRFVV